MGYEALQNYIQIRKIENSDDASFWLKFAKIVYDFIKERKVIKLIKQWKKVEENIPKYCYFVFYRLSEHLFRGLNEKSLVLYSLEKEEIFMQNYGYRSWDLINLGESFFMNKNYKKATKIFIKCIRQFRNSSDSKDLICVIQSCSTIAWVYLYRCKNQRKVKKIEKIVNKIIGSFGKSGALDEFLLDFYCMIQDWDIAHKIAWKLIKLYEKNQTNYLRSTKSLIYMYLALIYNQLGYNKKFLQALANAKSCCGILSVNDSEQDTINGCFGLFYYSNGQYKEAACYFEYIIDHQKDKEKLTYQILFAGMAHYEMKNYYKALQHFIEIEDDLLFTPLMDNNKLCYFYSCIGDSYNCTKNKERANLYFCKAYELLKCLECGDLIDKYDIFWYFLMNEDYENVKLFCKYDQFDQKNLLI